MSPLDPQKIRVLFEQLHALRQRVQDVDTSDTMNKMVGYTGSGISVFIPRFNSLLERAKALFPDDPVFREATDDIQPVREIEERHPQNQKRAKQELLLNADMVLQALAPFIGSSELGSAAIKVEREGLFLAGQHFDAMLRVTDIISQAQHSIMIVDGYVSHKVLDLLRGKRETTVVSLLTKKQSMPGEMATLAAAFNQQYGQKGPLSIRTSDAFHDRFLIVDDHDYYHFGASLKDLGSRGCMFSRIEEPFVVSALKAELSREWTAAKIVD